jgi:hypothetical protein
MPRVPAGLSAYVDTLGPELAAQVFLTLGGSEIALAGNSRGRSKLAALVGEDLATALAAHPAMPATKVRIPLANRWKALFLDWQGHSVGEIARRTRVSATTIYRYVREGRSA